MLYANYILIKLGEKGISLAQQLLIPCEKRFFLLTPPLQLLTNWIQIPVNTNPKQLCLEDRPVCNIAKYKKTVQFQI